MAGIGDETAEVVAVSYRVDDGTLVIDLAGELDTSTAPRVRAQVARLLSTRPGHVVFDLANLAFMDSSGIAVLLYAAGEVERVGVRNPSPTTRRALAATGLTDVLPEDS